MSKSRVFMWCCGVLAAAMTIIYTTALILSVVDGPAGVEVSYRLNSAAVAAISMCTVLSIGAWMTRRIVREENADLLAEVRAIVETGLTRAHTRGMVDEAAGRAGASNGTVTSIARRGE